MDKSLATIGVVNGPLKFSDYWMDTSSTINTTNMSGAVLINGEQFDVTISIVENIISSEIIDFTITTQSIPTSPAGTTTELSAQYQLVTNENESIATLSLYNVRIGNELAYSLSNTPSTLRVLKNGDVYDFSLIMYLIKVAEGNNSVNYRIQNACTLTPTSLAIAGPYGASWDWNEFAKETSKGALLGGAGTAAAALFTTDGGAPVSVPAAVAIGAVTGGALGALGYAHDWIWDAIFEGNDSPETVQTSTYAENDQMRVCHNSHSYTIPTLSEWKQIFLTLLILSLVIGFVPAQSNRIGQLNSNSMLRMINVNVLAFNRQLFYSVLKWIFFVAALGLVGATAISGHISMPDIIGTLFCAPLAAYILHIVFFD